MPQNEALLNEFDEEMKNTRKMLERIPDGKFEYKPHEKSMELGRLASHVAELPGWVKETLTLEVLEIQPGQKPFWAKTRQEILEAFDRNVSAGREKLASATDADLQKIWTLKFGDKTIFSMPRSQVLRGMVMNHMIHHRAQLGVYLRLNELEIPGMYGPSADEMKFWQPEPEKATA